MAETRQPDKKGPSAGAVAACVAIGVFALIAITAGVGILVYRNFEFQQKEADLSLTLPGIAEVNISASPHVIGLAADGTLTFDGKPVTSNEFDQQLQTVATTTSSPSIVIRAFDDVAEQRFVDLLNSIAKAGIKDISLTQ